MAAVVVVGVEEAIVFHLTVAAQETGILVTESHPGTNSQERH